MTTYIKPTQEQVQAGIEEGWTEEEAKRGYAIVDFDGTGMFEIEALSDVYLSVVGETDGYCDEACAREAERSGFCKIIPVEELPENFPHRYFGWVDTPENRERIKAYAERR